MEIARANAFYMFYHPKSFQLKEHSELSRIVYDFKEENIIIAIVIIAVGAVGVYLWQSLFVADAEGTTRDLVNKLSNHDAAGVWALLSQDGKDIMGPYAELEDILDDLQLMEWHATIQSIDNKEIETIGAKEHATLTLTLACTDSLEGTYTETWRVYLTKIDNEWKVNAWGPVD